MKTSNKICAAAAACALVMVVSVSVLFLGCIEDTPEQAFSDGNRYENSAVQIGSEPDVMPEPAQKETAVIPAE